MRVAVGKALRVGPGDEVLIRGQLPSNSRLARLFVFAKESNGRFHPLLSPICWLHRRGRYSADAHANVVRLDSTGTKKKRSFRDRDFDGFVQVMQEVDTAKDPRAIVKIKRKINPHLSWKEKLTRRFLAWKP